MSIMLRFFNLSRPTGNDPTKLLELTSNTFKFDNNPISSGKQPVRLLFIKINSFNVLAILPMLFGIQPVKLLLANTITETGELPRFSGMLFENRLLFTNKASRCTSKTFGGKGPSKSLKRRSR